MGGGFLEVKIFDGRKEVGQEKYALPITAKDLREGILDINAAWFGDVTKPDSNVILAGGFELSPGMYHFKLHDKPRKCKFMEAAKSS